MNRDEWVEAFAHRLELEPPSRGEIDDLLALAATAAHASERTAAPLACWLGGRSGKSLRELMDLAEGIGD